MSRSWAPQEASSRSLLCSGFVMEVVTRRMEGKQLPQQRVPGTGLGTGLGLVYGGDPLIDTNRARGQPAAIKTFGGEDLLQSNSST